MQFAYVCNYATCWSIMPRFNYFATFCLLYLRVLLLLCPCLVIIIMRTFCLQGKTCAIVCTFAIMCTAVCMGNDALGGAVESDSSLVISEQSPK